MRVELRPRIQERKAKNNPDAVIIATPNVLHENDTVQFLKAKIPVLLEKPISDTIKSFVFEYPDTIDSFFHKDYKSRAPPIS